MTAAAVGAGCESGAGTGALVGGGAGAALGALAGGPRYGLGGALLGGAIGAAGGAIVGNEVDREQDRRDRDRYYYYDRPEQDYVYGPREIIIEHSPYDYGPPPPAPVEVLPPRPYYDSIWVRGYWVRRPHYWVWVRGYWR